MTQATAHPWHGVSPQFHPPFVTAFIEIVPTDTVKYEIDKESGLLKVDRPQAFSNVCPAMYGFIPRSYCGCGVAALATFAGARDIRNGDHDPLDILIISEHSLPRGQVLVTAKPIGGLLMLDRGEADDKIIAVLKDDATYGGINTLSELPNKITERLVHYFQTYKKAPLATENTVQIFERYEAAKAQVVMQAAFADYAAEFKE